MTAEETLDLALSENDIKLLEIHRLVVLKAMYIYGRQEYVNAMNVTNEAIKNLKSEP